MRTLDAMNTLLSNGCLRLLAMYCAVADEARRYAAGPEGTRVPRPLSSIVGARDARSHTDNAGAGETGDWGVSCLRLFSSSFFVAVF